MGVARLDAFALSPLPCDDCRYCYRVDGCSKPDLKEFYTALEEADALAFVTPVYNRSFPSATESVAGSHAALLGRSLYPGNTPSHYPP